MLYLKSFDLLSAKKEDWVLLEDKRRIYNNVYPLKIFPLKQFEHIEFEPITIFYGDNGSGKSTLLNIIAQKLNAKAKEGVDKGSYFYKYVNLCTCKLDFNKPWEVKLISSDNVFNAMLNIRAINSNVSMEKEKLAQEYMTHKYSVHNGAWETYEELKNVCDSKKQSMSKYIRERLVNNTIIEYSNGESALMFWEHEIDENGIYILDEPENSLSAANQLKLKKFIEESARFYNCQFIISTHSPFLLNLECAKIYDLDESPTITKKWTELNSVQIYHEFFKEKENEFK